MKQLITLMALMLIEKNGETTNKDIKDGLRKLFNDDQNFRLTQKDVHLAMNDISKEQKLAFKLGYSSDGHEYRIWTLIPDAADATQTAADKDGYDSALLLAGIVPSDDNDDDELKKASTQLLSDTVVDTNGSLADSTKNVHQITSATVPAGFGKQLDPALGEITAYWKNDNSVYMQGNNRDAVRKEMLSHFKATTPGLKYDDIRVCSTEYYNKTVAGR